MTVQLSSNLRCPMYSKTGGGYTSKEEIAGYDVYGLIGQSNMCGRADIRVGIDDVYTEIQNKVFQFAYSTQSIQIATNPLDHVNDFAGDMGMWLEFVKARLPFLSSKRKILLVPNAQGGTSFANNHWNPGNTLYNSAVNSISAAMAQGTGNNVLKGLLWLQGESDADAGADAALIHRDKFQIMYESMKVAITGMTETTPFIVGSIKSNKPNATAINQGYALLDANNPAIQYVVTSDLTFFDSDHYDAASLATIGQRFASRF